MMLADVWDKTSNFFPWGEGVWHKMLSIFLFSPHVTFWIFEVLNFCILNKRLLDDNNIEFLHFYMYLNLN